MPLRAVLKSSEISCFEVDAGTDGFGEVDATTDDTFCEIKVLKVAGDCCEVDVTTDDTFCEVKVLKEAGDCCEVDVTTDDTF